MVAIDVTDRQQQAIANRRLLALLQNAPVALFETDAAGAVTYLSPAWERLTGQPATAGLGQGWVDFLHPEDREPVQAIWTAALASGEVRSSRHRFRTADGSYRWVQLTASPVSDAAGVIWRWFGSIMEIDDTVRAEQAERQAKEYAERLLALAAVIFVVLDEHGCIRTLNRKGCELLGCPEAEAIGKDWINTFVPERQRAEISAVFQAVLAGDQQLAEYHENPILTCRGEERLIAWRNTLLRDAEGRLLGVLSAGEDITESRRAFEALQESEERFRAMAETVPDILFTARPDGWRDYTNPRFYEYTGLPPGTAEGFGWTQALHPDDAAQVQAGWQKAIEAGSPLNIQYRLRAANGGYRWFQAHAHLISGNMGGAWKWFGVTSDIDDLIQAEQRLREADRRKDEFLALLAHELRNPLAPIRNAARIIRLLNPPEPQLQWAQRVIDQQVTQLARLVDDLLDVSRIVRGKVTLQREPIELAALVQEAVEGARSALEARRHPLSVTLPSQALWLEGDRIRLSQVLVNLLDNAAKYTPEGGKIGLTAEATGSEVALRVRDNGVGIPAAVLPRIFDLFEQGDRGVGHPQGGLGIGLTVVRRLVEQHGGRVEAASAGPGQGAEFTIWLPRLSEPPAAPAEKRESARDRRPLRILVTDDDVNVAQSTALWLQLEGYEVKTAATGEAALALYQSFQPQVVLLDIGLHGGMDGCEVARRLREQPGGQGLLLIAVTGYSHEEARAGTRAAGFDHHLVKPIDPDELAALLAEVDAGSVS